MKIEFNLIKNKIKKDKTWLIILLMLTIINIIYCYLNYNKISNNIYYMNLVAYPLINEKLDIYVLYNIYYITYIVYYSISYFNYELENLKENIVIRENDKKWFIRKVISILLYIVTLKLITILIIDVFSNFKYSFNINIILIINLYLFLISIITITVNNIVKKNTLVIIISIILSFLIFFSIKNILFLFILLLLLLVLNIIFFKFKVMYKLKEY